MTEREKLECLASSAGVLKCLADSRYCPPRVSGTACPPWAKDPAYAPFKVNCVICWRAWLLGGESSLRYIDTDSLNPDLPEEMY